MTQPTTLEGLKKVAKKAKKAAQAAGLELTHSQALEQVSKLAGYQNYHQAQRHLTGQISQGPRKPARSLSHIKKVATGLRREAKAANQVLTRHDALDLVARKYGYENYQAARADLPDNDPTPEGQF